MCLDLSLKMDIPDWPMSSLKPWHIQTYHQGKVGASGFYYVEPMGGAKNMPALTRKNGLTALVLTSLVCTEH